METMALTLSERVLAISPSVTLAIDAQAKKLRQEGMDVIGFGAGEPDFCTPEYINDAGVHLEARTTYVPTLHTKKDIINLVDEITADVYTIQQFRNKNVLDPALEKVEVPNPHDLVDLAREIKPYFDGIVKVKSGEFGEQVI